MKRFGKRASIAIYWSLLSLGFIIAVTGIITDNDILEYVLVAVATTLIAFCISQTVILTTQGTAKKTIKKLLFNFVTIFVLMLCFNFIMVTKPISHTIAFSLIGSAFAAIVSVWYDLIRKLSD